MAERVILLRNMTPDDFVDLANDRMATARSIDEMKYAGTYLMVAERMRAGGYTRFEDWYRAECG